MQESTIDDTIQELLNCVNSIDFNISNLSQFEFIIKQSDIGNTKIGLTTSVGLIDAKYCHFYLAIEGSYIYFSKSGLKFSGEKEIIPYNISKFDYFQLMMTYSYISYESLQKIAEFAKKYNWDKFKG